MTRPEELYRQFAEGNDRAFEELVILYRTPITEFVRRFVCGEVAAEDVAQDVFAELLEKRGFRYKSSLRSYLFAVARHKAIDHIRRHRREMVSDDTPCSVTAETPETALLQREKRELVKQALAQLKDDRRLALLLTTAEGLSYEEAARVLHTTPKHIKNLCYRARQQLHRVVQEDK